MQRAMMSRMEGGRRPEPGDILAEKYRLDDLLGRGTTGQAFVATHLELGHRVAIKVLRTDHPGAEEQILRELQIYARLTTPHVARVFDIGRSPGGAVFVVTELLGGEDLGRLLARGPVAPPDAARYVADTCAALGEAHGAGGVHRNLKPSNLFLAQRAGAAPIVKVLDFGATSDDSLPYRSPEQIQGQEADGRTDLWSIGVVLYELLTGRRPFRGDTTDSLARSILHDVPPRPSAVRAAVPAAFDAWVLRCLEKESISRFASAAELAQTLAPLAGASGHAPSPAPPRPAAPRQAAPSGPAAAFVGRTSRAGAPRVRWPWSILAAAAVAMAVGLWVWRWPTPPAAGAALHQSHAASLACSPPSIIDNMESERTVVRNCDRVTRWGLANDGSGTQWPSQGTTTFRALIPNGGRGESHYAVHTFGSGFIGWGFNLSCALNFYSPSFYDATQHGYTAVRFYAMVGDDAEAGPGYYANVVRVTVADRLSAVVGGLCSEEWDAGPDKCFDDPGTLVPVATEWRVVVVPFSTLRTWGWGNGGVRPLDTHSMISIGFSSSPPTAPFDLWIDDLSFQ